MAGMANGRWEQIREQRLVDPDLRDRYWQTRRSVTQVRDVIRRVEDARRQAGLSKAELARRLGTNPATIRRLLTAETANPTLKTVLDVFNVLGIELSLESRQPGSDMPRSADSPSSVPHPHR